jgi:hypothetical protein
MIASPQRHSAAAPQPRDEKRQFDHNERKEHKTENIISAFGRGTPDAKNLRQRRKLLDIATQSSQKNNFLCFMRFLWLSLR